MKYETWMIVGAIIIALEIFIGGTVILWFGIAAIIVGGLLFFGLDTGIQMQLVIFAALSLISVYAWRIYLRKYAQTRRNEPNVRLSRRAEHYIGQVVVLADEILNGTGKAKIEDTLWRVRGPDMPAGAKARVVGVDGATLLVEKET